MTTQDHAHPLFTVYLALQQGGGPQVSVQPPQLSGTLSVQLVLDLMLQPLIGCLEMLDLHKQTKKQTFSVIVLYE